MSFADFPTQTQVTQLLQRSLERDRLAHGYLFTGTGLEELEAVALTLAKTLNCLSPRRRSVKNLPLDSCDQCDSCRRIQQHNHPDVFWIRPESKSRIITIEQMRELMQTVNLKPTLAEFKVAVIVAADRLNVHAANAFLKTLEEPPSKSIILLLTTEPQRILETILSRCLRLAFAGEAMPVNVQNTAWLASFTEMAAKAERGLLGHYRLLGLILKKLADQKIEIEKALTAASPLRQYRELEPRMRDKLEEELAAAIEAEYRRQRAELIGSLQWWLRDVWLETLVMSSNMLCLPALSATSRAVAQRLSSAEAAENLNVFERLQRQLSSNVQEALALEVGLLKLKL